MILLLIALPFYFLPAFIAGTRNHRNGFAIFVLNFFTGWTLLGWIAAFIWACIGESTTIEKPKANPDIDWDRKAIYEPRKVFASMQTPLSEKLSERIFKD